MTAYSAADWEELFIAEAGASAALAGLLFVAVSISLTKILEVPGWFVPVVGLLSDRFLDAAGPRIAVPGEHEVRGELVEAGQGSHRLLRIRGEGRNLRATGTRGDRVGRERVAFALAPAAAAISACPGGHPRWRIECRCCATTGRSDARSVRRRESALAVSRSWSSRATPGVTAASG
jgi:modulator of FtsH protease